MEPTVLFPIAPCPCSVLLHLLALASSCPLVRSKLVDLLLSEALIALPLVVLVSLVGTFRVTLSYFSDYIHCMMGQHVHFLPAVAGDPQLEWLNGAWWYREMSS